MGGAAFQKCFARVSGTASLAKELF